MHYIARPSVLRLFGIFLGEFAPTVSSQSIISTRGGIDDGGQPGYWQTFNLRGLSVRTDLKVSCCSGSLCQKELSHNIDLISTSQPGRVSDPGKLNDAGLGAARCHLLGSRRQQEVGLASTQHESWASHRIPHRP